MQTRRMYKMSTCFRRGDTLSLAGSMQDVADWLSDDNLICAFCLAGLMVLEPGVGVSELGEVGVGVRPGREQPAVVSRCHGVVFGGRVGAGDAVEGIAGVGALLEGVFVSLFGFGV